METTKKVIEEVNAQFKNPVRIYVPKSNASISSDHPTFLSTQRRIWPPLFVCASLVTLSHFIVTQSKTGTNYFCRISVPVWNRTLGPRVEQIRYRYSKYYHQPSPLPWRLCSPCFISPFNLTGANRGVFIVQRACQDATKVYRTNIWPLWGLSCHKAPFAEGRDTRNRITNRLLTYAVGSVRTE